MNQDFREELIAISKGKPGDVERSSKRMNASLGAVANRTLPGL